PNDNICHSYWYGLRAIIQCLPAWLRFIQCLRRYRDTKRAFPHLVNAGKYSTTFFVVTFAALYATHIGKTQDRRHISTVRCPFYDSSPLVLDLICAEQR
ncbi:Xenotropic and polytropic retrovirus receptor 1, partial [Xenotaenia resolanae]